MAAPAAGSNLYLDPTIVGPLQTLMGELSSTACVTMNLTASAFIDVNQNGTYEAGTDCLGSSYPLAIEFRPSPQMQFTESDGQSPIANPLAVCEISSMGTAQVEFTLAGPTIACDDCLLRYRLIGAPVINDPNLGAAYDGDGSGADISNSQTAAINFDATTPGVAFTTTFTDNITIAQDYDFHEAATITYQFRSWTVCDGTALCFGPIETMVAEIIPAPKVRFLDGTTSLDLPTDGSEVRTVCNGDEEDLTLRVRSNFTETVTYDITTANVTPAGALNNIWMAGSTVASAAA